MENQNEREELIRVLAVDDEPKVITKRGFLAGKIMMGMGLASMNFAQSYDNTPKDLRNARRVPVTTGEKVRRNDPCTCGSGIKYKKCCGF